MISGWSDLDRHGSPDLSFDNDVADLPPSRTAKAAKYLSRSVHVNGRASSEKIKGLHFLQSIIRVLKYARLTGSIRFYVGPFC